ncbi:MAG: sigma-70 family RNA polymerase sigma factor [Armatimonadetes bacterium]|nr:sigma-70 family RNA polymerase sigma factor [Armatimonadota bacterium]
MLAVLEARLPGLDASAQPRQARPAVSERSADEDLDLMERIKGGDADAFNRLMEKHEKTVMNLVYRFTGDRESAEDLAQDVFLRIYRAAGRFQARAKFFTYLYKVTLNLCRNARDKAGRRRHSSLDAGPGDDLPPQQIEDPSGSAEDQVARQELAAVVRDAVLSLPEDQREVVIMQRYQGLQYEEIGEILGISVAAVKSRIHRAKINLKKSLAPYVTVREEKSDE